MSYKDRKSPHRDQKKPKPAPPSFKIVSLLGRQVTFFDPTSQSNKRKLLNYARNVGGES